MNKMVTFRDNVQVPALGQGTWNMGNLLAERAEELKALRAGIELGMTAIDTAEYYGNGRSEQLVGEAISGLRDRIFLISKVTPSHASRQGTIKACEGSLKRLGTDYLDLYLLHWRGSVPLEETVAGMLELQKAGKIRRWGVSNMDVADMEQFFNVEGGNTCAANEVLYNLTRRGIEFDLLPWCVQHHLPVIAYSPVEQGRLLGHPVLVELAEKYAATTDQLALAWVLRQPGVLAIPKAATLKHVQENFKSLSLHIKEADLKLLDKAFPAPKRKRRLEMI